MSVAVIGGGMMGLTIAYRLAQRGVRVEVWEAQRAPGGLAGATALPDGTVVDRFYHTVLPSDGRVRQLCEDVGLGDELRFRDTRMGFYHEGQLYPMNGLGDFLRFPPLTWVDRLRLGTTVLRARTVHDWHALEQESAESWLRRWSGTRTFEHIWAPLLRAKFDGDISTLPATYIWARIVRVQSSRTGAGQKEAAGYLRGGYARLAEALAAEIEQLGGTVHLGVLVSELVTAATGQRVLGVRVDGRAHPSEGVVLALPLPATIRLLSGGTRSLAERLAKVRHLGVVCMLLALEEPLSGYWTLNITDPAVPFTGVIETTTYIDPEDVGGHHLVYLPKYTAPDSIWQRASEAEIVDSWLHHLETMLPSFDRRKVRHLMVAREAHVEPLRLMSDDGLVPSPDTGVEGLFLASSAQVYPRLTNVESIVAHADHVVERMLASPRAAWRADLADAERSMEVRP